MPSKTKKYISLFLCLVLLLLSACSSETAAVEAAEEVEEAAEEDEISGEEETVEEETVKTDTVFSICYSSQSSMNPLYGTNSFNNDIFSLMYEGLFRLSDSFEPEGVLCTDYYTRDGRTFYFTIRSGVTFHSGSTLTAEDAAYSLNKAAGSSKYSSRFRDVIAVNAQDSQTLVVTLSETNYAFPALLDIPIIQDGSAEDSVPSGTGPYAYRAIGQTRYLIAFSSHRDYDSLPIDRIYLVEETTSSLSQDFSIRTIDVLNYDRNGNVSLNVHINYEARNYNTTNLVYIGFNCGQGITSDAEFRSAVRYLVDEDAIYSEELGSLALKSPLILSPALPYYDEAWEDGIYYSRQEFSAYIMTSEMSDSDSDGFFESPIYGDFTITVLVNSESEYKTEIAERLVTSLKNNGIPAEVLSLSWSEYVENLGSGTYNMYIGEVKVPADFDFTELLTPGGSLNYGNISDAAYSELISAFLASEGDEKTLAAEALCKYVSSDNPIIPLAYKKYTVATHVGVVNGLSPSVSGVFSRISECTINP